MNARSLERLCVWSGVICITLFTLGFVFAGFIPPPSPSRGIEEVVAYYQQHATGIRASMVLMMISGMFVPPLVALISVQMRRIPGALVFVVCAFRPDRPADITYMLNDMGWIVTVIPWSPAFIQNVIIGTAILSDKSAQPVFPRWLAYFNFWVAIGFIPGGLLPFFKSGPFAWNGAFVFWLAGSVFIAWFIVMTVMLLKAIRRQELETAAR